MCISVMGCRGTKYLQGNSQVEDSREDEHWMNKWVQGILSSDIRKGEKLFWLSDGWKILFLKM